MDRETVSTNTSLIPLDNVPKQMLQFHAYDEVNNIMGVVYHIQLY